MYITAKIKQIFHFHDSIFEYQSYTYISSFCAFCEISKAIILNHENLKWINQNQNNTLFRNPISKSKIDRTSTLISYHFVIKFFVFQITIYIRFSLFMRSPISFSSLNKWEDIGERDQMCWRDLRKKQFKILHVEEYIEIKVAEKIFSSQILKELDSLDQIESMNFSIILERKFKKKKKIFPLFISFLLFVIKIQPFPSTFTTFQKMLPPIH